MYEIFVESKLVFFILLSNMKDKNDALEANNCHKHIKTSNVNQCIFSSVEKSKNVSVIDIKRTKKNI